MNKRKQLTTPHNGKTAELRDNHCFPGRAASPILSSQLKDTAVLRSPRASCPTLASLVTC